MKILKMHIIDCYNSELYYCMFDEIPEITYEKMGDSFVGSAIDGDGNIVFSSYLKYSTNVNAFAGRELTLKMKDGTIRKIKDHWWDSGTWKEHGDFIHIGAGTLEDLQRCYVYCAYNINKKTFQKMLDDYYSREKLYEYYEIKDWADMQYEWFPVVIDGKNYPLMVNEKGHFIEIETNKRRYLIHRYIKHFRKQKMDFQHTLFKYEYHDGNRLVKIERKAKDVLRESIPLTEDEIAAIIKGGR